MSRLTAKSSTSNAATSKNQSRDPPPALFLHPSREASHVSLPGIGGAAGDVMIGSPIQQQQTHSSQTGASAMEYSTGGGTGAGAGGGAPLTRTATATSISAARTRHHLPLPLPLQPPPPQPPAAVARLPTGNSTTTTVRTADRTDALWAEMQATLEDVELSAGSGGTRVFGPDHDRALAELRAAQIALAQAWARSEADDAIETSGGFASERHRDNVGGIDSSGGSGSGGGGGGDVVQGLKSALGDVGIAAVAPASAAAATTGGREGGGGGVAAGAPSNTGSAAAAAAAGTATATTTTGGDHHTDAGKSTTGGGGGTTTRPGSSGAGTSAGGGVGSGGGGNNGLGGERLGAKLVQETQTDILHARKRRDANDRYFKRVDQGVRDVVARLEEVAAAMQAVEQETREVWGDGGSASASVVGGAKG